MKQLAFLLLVFLFIITCAGRAQTVLPIQNKKTESDRLNKMVGKWAVTMSLRPTPDTASLVQQGVVADRSMVGDFQDSITSYIISFPYPGFGPDLKGRGQAVYTRNVIIKKDDDHDVVKQYWRLTDKPEWLAVEYEYTRQSNKR